MDGNPGREPGEPKEDLARGGAAFSTTAVVASASAGEEAGFWVTMIRSLLRAAFRTAWHAMRATQGRPSESSVSVKRETARDVARPSQALKKPKRLVPHSARKRRTEAQ